MGKSENTALIWCQYISSSQLIFLSIIQLYNAEFCIVKKSKRNSPAR